MKTQNSVSRKIWILHKIKKGYFKQKCLASEKYFNFYALNTWLGLLLNELLHQCGVAWRQSAPWHCSGVMKLRLLWWWPSAHLHCWVWCLSSRFSVDFRSGEFAGQSSTVTLWSLNQLLVPLAEWAGAEYCWKMKSASVSVNACQQKEAWSALKFLVDGCVDCGLQKTQWTNTRRWHGSPNHHRLWKLHTGLIETWMLCLSTLPPDSGTLISKWNAKC